MCFLFLWNRNLVPLIRQRRLFNEVNIDHSKNSLVESKTVFDENNNNCSVEQEKNIPIKYADVIELMKRIVEMDKAFLSEIKTDENLETSQEELKNMLLLRMKAIEDLTRRYSGIFNTANEESQKFAQLILDKFPELNKKEVRLCYYFKLNFSSKEISNLEGLTDGSVRVYKTKIKTKMKVPASNSLTTFLRSIEVTG